MQDTENNKFLNQYNDEINIQELFQVLFQGKWIIIALTTFISIAGVIYSLLLPNIYESKALLVPVNTSGSINSAIGGGYRSLAGLAGVNLSSGEGYSISNDVKALEKIKSLSFFENNILPNINLQDLMAVKSWNSSSNILIYDQSIYDAKSNTWVMEDSSHSPSAQRSFGVFINDHLRISSDTKTGFIILSIKHQSPFIAKQLIELVVNEINIYYRQKDKLESEKTVTYLNEQISMTGLSEIKIVLAQLLQEETKKLSLIEANQSYVFEYIDPPAIMENKAEPNRSIICISIAILGGVLSILMVLIRHYIIINKIYK